MTVQLGILLALLCAFTTNLGFLLKHRGACAAPDVSMRHPLKSAVGLFKSKWFAIGMLVALIAWIFHVAALAMAPLSLVQAVISGGLVFLTVLADRFFGCTVGPRQWAGVGLTALGLCLLAVTLPHGTDASSAYSTPGMIVFEAGLLGVGMLLVFHRRFGAHHEHHGVLMGTAAGILFGVSDVAIKAMTGGGQPRPLLALAASPASPRRSWPSTPRPAASSRVRPSRSSRSPAPPPTCRPSPAGSSSSATRCPATRSASSSRPPRSSW